MNSRSTTKDFPGFDRIFSLGDPCSNPPFRGDVGLETDSRRLTRAEILPASPLTVTWAMGRAKPSDVVWTTMAIMTIISDSVVELLRSHGFTGWTLYDVSVRDKQGQLIPGYHGLAFTGRCGPIDNSRSVEVPRIRPGGIFPVWKGLLFDPASWDGSDLFMSANGTGWTFVVEDVKKALERAKIRNLRFTPLDQIERSAFEMSL